MANKNQKLKQDKAIVLFLHYVLCSFLNVKFNTYF